MIARETARTLPHAVSRVITYGTPAIGGPTYTLGARAFGRSESDRIRSMITELIARTPSRSRSPQSSPAGTASSSWPACIDRTSPDVEHIEVRSTHAGMGLDPNVWQIVATRLATPN